TIKIKGNPLVFNSYLNNDQFFFNEGKFELDVNYTGEAFSLENIISDGEMTLSIDSSFVLYEPLSVTFPLTNIGLSVKKNIAKYSILMQSDTLNQEIKFDGKVQNISEIIVEDTGKPVRTTSNIYSPRVTWKNFIDIFSTDSTQMDIPIDTVKTQPKTSTGKFCQLLYRFSPDIIMRFDTLEYSNELCVHDFSTELSLVDSVFYISDSKFEYRGSDVLMNSVIHLSDDIDSIDAKLNATTIDIENLITDLEELTKKDLSSINYISGTLDFDANISQYYRASDQLIDTTINGDLNFTISDLIIDEAPWMEKIGRKLLQPNRFKNVRFAPISNQLTFRNDSLYIPLMEIQSTAFDVFVDGHYHSDHPNVWLSLPLFNLKERDISVIPKKEGFARRKMKLHFEYAMHNKAKPNVKLRLSKRKFYKDRGQLDLWKKIRKSKK
ncbi:AsmA-like C-terminal region-containing protein, partial [Saprospiraceae bacterium]|nr:AsmA-like C-terminal region-containing protein [Saprospiraceae bacterium]